MSLSGAILASGAGALVFIPFSLKRPVTLLIASVAPTRGNFESGYFSEYHVHLPVSALTPIVDITFPRRSTTGTTYSEGLPDSECKRSGLSLIHISEPTRLGMISYAVFCLKK